MKTFAKLIIGIFVTTTILSLTLIGLNVFDNFSKPSFALALISLGLSVWGLLFMFSLSKR